jgi:uncharacterized ferritin-like protein (DUF455 family)
VILLCSFISAVLELTTGKRNGVLTYDSGPVHKEAQNYCRENRQHLTEKDRGYIVINNHRLKYYMLAVLHKKMDEVLARMEKMGREKRIVLVDPNELLRKSLIEFMGREGYAEFMHQNVRILTNPMFLHVQVISKESLTLPISISRPFETCC